ncbi:MAG: sporulation protein YunB [Corallococcus sp.]|nr:sporulation protein YunB [Corallococcus sp.]MCM1359183.1 sporulation protein YunB [Corallococcus sp.]MCM1394573.1 sporulation protein YunB [Corallococcus sp.]
MSSYVVVNHAEKRKKRKRVCRKCIAVLLVALFCALGVAMWIYWKSMTPTILEIVEVRVQSEATRAANEAVLSVFAGGVKYDDMVAVERNSANEIVMLTANQAVVNELARDTSIVTQNKITSLFGESIDIPFGTLTGIPLLNEVGPNVSISVSPVGAVTCKFVSHFESAGINQTLHRIYLHVESRVDVIVPTMHKILEINTPILVCETIIVGKIPDTFLQGGVVLSGSV